QAAARGGRISAAIFDRRATKACGKRPAARRVVPKMAVWLRCASVTGPCGHAPSLRLAIQPFSEQRHVQLFKTLCLDHSTFAWVYRSVTISVRVLSMMERSSFCSLLGILSLSSDALR